MSAVSLSLSRGQVDVGPDNMTVGTLAPNANDVEVRISLTNTPTSQDVVILLEAIIRRILDERYNDVVNV